jgi:phosphate transport system permease protein
MKFSPDSQVQQPVRNENRFIRPRLPDRSSKEKWVGWLFFIITLVPLALLAAITIVLVVRTWPILQKYSLWDLISSTVWRPEKGLFGFFPFISGTFWVTATGLVLAVPACIFTAIYLAEYAHRSTRTISKPLLDLLAAIPSVVYGVWGLVAIVPIIGTTIAPFCYRWLGFIPFFTSQNPTGYGILAGGIVLAVMITPLIISVTYEVLAIVPNGVREASLALGATRWQTIHSVVIPHGLPGIVAGVVLGASRALGETMAVLMVVGNVVQVPHSIFDAAYPLSALIANNYGEMMSIPLYDAALLGASLILLLIILLFNISSTLILRRILGRVWV